VKNLAEALLIAMGDSAYARGSAIQKTQRAIHLAKEKEIKLFIFDEVQHFIDRSKKGIAEKVADWFKTFINSVDASVFLVGLHRSEELLDSYEQLRRRFSRRIEINPLSLHVSSESGTNLTTSKNCSAFRDTLKSFIAKLKQPTSFDIETDISLQTSFYFATYGIAGYMVKLLEGALLRVAETEEDLLSRSVLEYAFTQHIWHKGRGANNPFNVEFIGWQLDNNVLPIFLRAH
jgi:predicted AAA+ superfamily ATPase